jgi:hypothetical protein
LQTFLHLIFICKTICMLPVCNDAMDSDEGVHNVGAKPTVLSQNGAPRSLLMLRIGAQGIRFVQLLQAIG